MPTRARYGWGLSSCVALLAASCGLTQPYPWSDENGTGANGVNGLPGKDDAGTPPEHAPPDSGSVTDAGFDAGPPDAGITLDAGLPDAGSPFDAGPPPLSCDGGYVWTVAPISATYVTGISGTGPNDVWVGGGLAFVAHWDGTQWTQIGGAPEARFIWEVAPNDVWSGAGSWFHWDGNTWTNPWVSPGMPVNFWSSDPNHLFATDWNGNVSANFVDSLVGDAGTPGWSTIYWGVTMQGGGYAVTYPLYGLSGSGPDDVWAVGDMGYAAHCGGAGCVGSQIPTRQLLSVTVLDPGNAWAVGIWGSVFHWNGSAWEDHSTAGLNNYDAQAWSNSPANIWLTSDDDIQHWDGKQWLTEGPLWGGITALWGTGCQVWAGTGGGLIFTGQPGPPPDAGAPSDGG